jgi:chromosome segregation ATPase
MSTASSTLKDVSDRLANNPSCDDLIGVIETLVAKQAEAQQERERLRQENEQLREELSEVRDENEQLESELESVRDRAGRDRAELSSRVTELEESVDEPQDGSEETDSPGSNPSPQTENTTLHEAVTPLEKVTRLPEGAAESSLSRNLFRSLIG